MTLNSFLGGFKITKKACNVLHVKTIVKVDPILLGQNETRKFIEQTSFKFNVNKFVLKLNLK